MIEIVYDGTSLSRFSQYCFPNHADDTAAHEYDEFYVIGRQGALLVDTGTMKNVERSYDVIFADDAHDQIHHFEEFLMSKTGYKRLETSLYPDEYYMAAFRSYLSPKLTQERGMAKVTVAFDCKPQRFLKLGEKMIEIGTALRNPTLYPAYPIIRLWGNGTFAVNSDTITVADSPHEYIDIDCELMDCYYMANNANNYVTFSTHDFITLAPGNNGFSNNGFSKVEIKPRWYTL